MSILLFSDLHCHNREQFSERLPSGRNSRLQDCLNVVEQAIVICEERNIQSVFFLGDVFESRTKLDIDVLTSTSEVFKRLSKACKNLFMLVGNHDQYTKVGEVHSMEIFRDFAEVIDSPKIDEDSLTGWTAAFYPHTSDVPGMKEWIKKMPQVDLFLFHQGLSEASVGPYDMNVKTEISIKDLPLDKTRYCIAGDYHKRQFLANGKFHYLGSPLQLSFSERGDRKCFTLIKDDWTIEEIETDAPRFYEFDSAEEYKLNSQNIRAKDFVRVSDPDRIVLDEIKTRSPKVQTVLVKQADIKHSRVGEEVLKDDTALLQTWITRANTELDPDLLLEEGRALLLGSD